MQVEKYFPGAAYQKNRSDGKSFYASRRIEVLATSKTFFAICNFWSQFFHLGKNAGGIGVASLKKPTLTNFFAWNFFFGCLLSVLKVHVAL